MIAENCLHSKTIQTHNRNYLAIEIREEVERFDWDEKDLLVEMLHGGHRGLLIVTSSRFITHFHRSC